MNSYNQLKTDSDIIKYYKTVLSELKTKRYKCSKDASKLKFLDAEIESLENAIEKELNKLNNENN